MKKSAYRQAYVYLIAFIAIAAIIGYRSAFRQHVPSSAYIDSASTTLSLPVSAASTNDGPRISGLNVQSARAPRSVAPSMKVYENDELGFEITIPKSYSVVEHGTSVSIAAQATNTQPSMEISVAPTPCDMSGKPVSTPTDYIKANFGLAPKYAFYVSRSNAIVVDHPRTFSLNDPTANSASSSAVYSSNIVGYKTFREMYVMHGCYMYSASYYVGDASFFDDTLPTFDFTPNIPGIPETQAPAFNAR